MPGVARVGVAEVGVTRVGVAGVAVADVAEVVEALPSVFSLTPEGLGELLGGSGRAKLVWELLRQGLDPFGSEGAEALPEPTHKALVERLAPLGYAACGAASVSECGTHKLLLSLPNGGDVELVLIPHRSAAFTSLCVSSQVGCRQACAFCATGAMGLSRSLLSSEIAAQLWLALAHVRTHKLPPLRNVVFMGMGEPLDNALALRHALHLFTHPFAFRIAPKSVCVSTVAPSTEAIAQMTQLPARLAWSVHAADDLLRKRLVPTASASVVELRDAFARVLTERGKAGEGLLIEMTLIDRVNDTPQHAQQLLQLLAKLPGKTRVNLIPYNENAGLGAAAADWAPSPEVSVKAFQREMLEGGFICTVRTQRGAPQSAACGRLATRARAWGAWTAGIAASEAASERQLEGSRSNTLLLDPVSRWINQQQTDARRHLLDERRRRADGTDERRRLPSERRHRADEEPDEDPTASCDRAEVDAELAAIGEGCAETPVDGDGGGAFDGALCSTTVHDRPHTTTRLATFSYGSNSVEQLRTRCENGALTAEAAVLRGYKRIFGSWGERWGGAVASLAQSDDPNAAAYGSVVYLSEEELILLDPFEGILPRTDPFAADPANKYRRVHVEVELPCVDSSPQPCEPTRARALAYILNTPTWEAYPSESYLAAVYRNLAPFWPQLDGDGHLAIYDTDGNERGKWMPPGPAIFHPMPHEEAAAERWSAQWRERLDAWWLALPASTASQLQSCSAFLMGALVSRFERWSALLRADANMAIAAPPPPAARVESAQGHCEAVSKDAIDAFPDFPEMPASQLKWLLPPIWPARPGYVLPLRLSAREALGWGASTGAEMLSGRGAHASASDGDIGGARRPEVVGAAGGMGFGMGLGVLLFFVCSALRRRRAGCVAGEASTLARRTRRQMVQY